MKNHIIYLFTLTIITLPGYLHGQYHNGFTQNKGQWEKNILYKTPLPNGALFIEENGLTYTFYNPEDLHTEGAHHNHFHEHKKRAVYVRDKKVNFHCFKIEFLHANKDISFESEDPQQGYSNYFIGQDKNKWVRQVNSFQKIRYKNLYNGIDLIVEKPGLSVKYTFIVHPFANPNDIKLKYEGHDSLFAKNNELHIITSVNSIIDSEPLSYQKDKNNTIHCTFNCIGNMVQFEFPEGYDNSVPLTIDPEVIFSSYSGSTADNWGFTATHDSYGNGYSGGIVFNVGYPVTTGAYQVDYAGGVDIGILKYSSDGNELLYATYLGGSQPEMPHSFIVNEFDELLIFGTTSSTNFPVSDNAYDKTFNGGDSVVYDNLIFRNGFDIFVSRLSENGDELLASTYVGGSKNDGLNYKNGTNNYNGNGGLYYNYGDGARGEIITDDQNNVYIGSCTFSNDFPVVSSSFQTSKKGRQEGIVFKLDYNLSTLVWSTYLGGGLDDAIYSIDVDRNYDLYVTGGTMSVQDTMVKFPTTQGAYMSKPAGGTRDGFVTKISNDGRQMLSSTFFGSDAYDQSYFVRSDKYNNVYIFGQTEAQGSTLIHNVQYSNPNSGQFIAKFGPHLDELIWSTVFGSGIGRPNISPTAFSVDICQRIYLSGSGREWTNRVRIYTDASRTESRLVNLWDDIQGTKNMEITDDAYQKETDGKDFYIMVLKPEAEGLDYATFLGELYDGGYFLEKWENNQRISVETIGCPYSGHDHVDGGTSRFDKIGNIYQSVCGSCGGCQGFPVTSNAWSQTNNSTNCNNALIKFNVHNDILIADYRKPDVGCAPYAITFENRSTLVDNTKVEFKWDFDDGTKSNQRNPSHVFQNSGKYMVQLVVNDLTSCNLTDTIIKEVIVLSDSTYTIEDKTICKYSNTIIGIEPVNDQNTTYSWFPETGISDPTLPNPYASPGETTKYLLTATNGICTDSIFQIVHVDSVSANIEEISDESCFGYCDGSINIETSSNDSIQFFWTDKKHNGSQANDLCQGRYSVILKNSLNCADTLSFTINGNEPLVVQLPDTFINTCSDNCDIQISPEIDGGAKPYTYLWSNGQEKTYATNLCKGGYWLEVTDNLGCMSIDSAVIEINKHFDIQIKEIHQPVCFGDCNGYAEVEILGANNEYTILWNTNPPQNTLKAAGLCAGEYNVTVSNSANCFLQETIEIAQVDSILTTIDSIQHPECNTCDGFISLSTKNGESPYSYIWDDGTTGYSKTNLCGGEHWVKVLDKNNCIDTTIIQVKEIGKFNIDKRVSKQLWCNGNCDGQIQISVKNEPIDNYAFTWDEFPNTNTSYIKKLCAGTYHFTITDKDNCKLSDSIELTEPERLLFDYHLHSTKVCYDQKTEIKITPKGGIPDYELFLNNIYLPEYELSLPAGEHDFKLIDKNKCTIKKTISIFGSDKLFINATTENQLCTNNCNGIIEANPVGGNYPYTLYIDSVESHGLKINYLCAGQYHLQVIDNDGCFSDSLINIKNNDYVPELDILTNDSVLCPGESTQLKATSDFASYFWTPENEIDAAINQNPNITPKNSGYYKVTALDFNNCVSEDSIYIAVDNIIGNLNIEAQINQPVLCNGDCNGSAHIFGNPATNENLTYLWEEFPDNKSSIINNICAGTYHFTVKDIYNCEISDSITIEEPPALSLEHALNTPIQCFGQTTEIKLIASGGTPDYTYFMNNNPLTSQTPSISAGEYNFELVDKNNCKDNFNILIHQPEKLTLGIDSKPQICTNNCNGEIIISPEGGTLPYQVSFNSVESDSLIFPQLCAGIYPILINDKNGCTIDTTVEIINEDYVPKLQITTDDNELCTGQSTQLQATSGFTSYTWNPEYQISTNNIKNPVVNPKKTTVYTLFTFDEKNCKAEDSILITVRNVLEYLKYDKQIIQPISCFGDCNAKIQLSVLNATDEKFNYLWAGYPDVNTSQLSGACSGTYHFTIQDKNGCEISDSIILTQPDELIFEHQINSSIQCYGKQAIIQLLHSGGTPDYELFMNEEKITSPEQTLSAGDYIFRLVDANACQKEFDITIEQPEKLALEIKTTNQICTNNCNGEIQLSPTGGISPYKIIFNSLESKDLQFQKLCAGEYPIHLSDKNACSIDTVAVIENEGYSPELQITPEDTLLYPGQSTQLMTISDCITFHWSPSNGINDTESSNPVVEPKESQYYRVTAYDENNCMAMDSVFIHIETTECKDPYIFVPNAFTPDDNAYGNNILYVRSNVIEEMQLSIYNRWGQLVFTSRDINKGWDGTYQGRKVDPAVFVYYLKATCFNGETFEKKGNITVLR